MVRLLCIFCLVQRSSSFSQAMQSNFISTIALQRQTSPALRWKFAIKLFMQFRHYIALLERSFSGLMLATIPIAASTLLVFCAKTTYWAQMQYTSVRWPKQLLDEGAILKKERRGVGKLERVEEDG